ncbi:pyridoxamine 5'-phosphate oxidase family protein [Nonomuraea sp. B19D2]|uniref:pyridoxamine 5'-phosphate oxidase family protein n=1 Tax=Nonomuraea sp. B19D2 TaxID=3159561 RepID=UPI0032DAC6C9
MIDRIVRDFLDGQTAGVLATTRPDGTARQSVVYFALDGDRLLISTEPRRAKAKDVERTGRASLCVIGPTAPYPSVTLEGAARIRATGIGADTAPGRGDRPGAMLIGPGAGIS